MSQDDCLNLINKLDSGAATDEEFKRAVQACKDGLKEVDEYLTAEEWKWIEQSQELFGKRDFQSERLAWEKTLERFKDEYKTGILSDDLRRVKLLKVIKEIKEKLIQIDKDETEWRLSGCPIQRK